MVGLLKVREALKATLKMQVSGSGKSFWEEEKMGEIHQLIQAASGIYVEATTEAPTMTTGQAITINFELANRSGSPLEINSINSFGLIDVDTAFGKELRFS